MSALIGALRVSLSAETAQFEAGMKRAQRTTAQSAMAMKKSATDLQLTLKEVATFSSRLFRTGALVFGGAFGAQKLLEMADAAKTLSAQLRLATSQYGSFAQANKDVREIAERSRSDLLATADLYSALMRNSDQFGGSQEQVARVTETVSKTFKISGASADEAANATRQLVQAFQSGRLQGDEFRSMMENAPRLARLLADSLGITVGKLREMSKEGKLTADVLVRAFSDKKFTAGLDEEFKALPVTFDQAMGQLYNAALITFSEFDRGGQFSNSIANFVSDGVDGFETLGKSAFHWGEVVGESFTALEQIRDELGALKTDGIGSFLGLQSATYSWHDALADTLGVLDGVANAFANLANAPGNLLRMTTGKGGAPILNPSNMRGSFLDKTNKARTDAVWSKIRDPHAIPDMLAEFGRGKKPPPFHVTSMGGGGGSKGRTRKAPRDRSDDVAFQFEREQQQADLDILHAKQQLAGSSQQRAVLDAQIIQLEHDMQAAEIDDRVRRAERDKAEGKITQGALDQVKAQAVTLKARNDEATALKMRAFVEEKLAEHEQDLQALTQQQFKFAIENLHAADAAATTQAEHRRIQLQILDAEYEARRLELENNKNLAIRNGATAEQIKLIQDQIDNLANQKATDRSAVTRDTRGPLEDYFSQVPKNADEANEAMQRLEVQGIDGAINSIIALTDGFSSFRDTAVQAIKQVLAEMLKMQLMKLALNLFGAAAGGGSIPGFSQGTQLPVDFGGGGSLFSGTPGFATGGSMMIGGHSGVDRNVLSMNGLPIARVSRGEGLHISPNGMAGAGGNVININVSGNPTRETLNQIAARTRGAIAGASRAGV